MISRILVANRGEIARRVFRTCRRMGITTVAVFSDADRDQPHAREADEAVPLHGVTPADTYLNIPAVLAAAKSAGADAIHPGYGFLSENPAFATAVTEAGLTWIGPSPEAIAAMGSKLTAKRLMDEAGVPSLPTIEPSGTSVLRSAALAMGFPVLVKASAGGGGKGMRVVHDLGSLQDAIESAQREAESSFGDDSVFIEKYLPAPRHIEIQVLGDSHGGLVSLHERECSIQRRHQKIIEEAPSPVVDDILRTRLGEAAVEVARVVDYVGAGTVEFLFQDGRFYFLEMNTRLQVEHPVTEMITGLDLVEEQIVVADGGRISDPPPIEGHAIEARLYAEDPVNDFLPVTGRFHRFEFDTLLGLRVDSGIEGGSEISIHYDPMIAKVIAHAPDRRAAAELLSTALRQARIHGSTTNRSLLVRVLEHPEFISGQTDTHFLDRHDPAGLASPLLDPIEERAAAVATALADQEMEHAGRPVLRTIPSGWRNSPTQGQNRSYAASRGRIDVWYRIDGDQVEVRDEGRFAIRSKSTQLVILDQGGSEMEFTISRYGSERFVDTTKGPAHLVEIPRFPSAGIDEAAGSLHAPMPGKVIRVEVTEGDAVTEGQVLVVLEAMKMEHTLRAPHPGTVTSVHHATGDQVEADAVLVVVEEG